jgi:hypothetical protein
MLLHICPNHMVASGLPVTRRVRRILGRSIQAALCVSYLYQSLNYWFEVFHRGEHERIDTHSALIQRQSCFRLNPSLTL